MISTQDIWLLLSTKQESKIIGCLEDPSLPLAFKSWLKRWVRKFQQDYDRIDFISRAIVDNRPGTNNRERIEEYFNEPGNKPYSALCSALLDHRDSGKMIWEMIKPTTLDSFKICIPTMPTSPTS